MAYKPSDFFVSVGNFLGVILPGAVLSFAALQLLGLKDILKNIFKDEQLPKLDKDQGWVAFILASYVVGHLVVLFGRLLDPIYDYTYRELNAALTSSLAMPGKCKQGLWDSTKALSIHTSGRITSFDCEVQRGRQKSLIWRQSQNSFAA